MVARKKARPEIDCNSVIELRGVVSGPGDFVIASASDTPRSGGDLMTSRRTLLTYAAVMGLPISLISPLSPAAAPVPLRERQNINQFAADLAKVAALRAGVARMKTISTAQPDDPAGWTYWASIHGVTEDSPPALAAVYAQCDHTYFGTPGHLASHFLSWHRAYLFFFESTLKAAARANGVQTAFELPYWNWYADGDLPKIFTEGAEATNPLWHDRISSSVDPTSLHREFFKQPALLPDLLATWQASFSVPLEMNPHGSVHGVIGGDMGAIQTSARDPIFWLHHANIDRLWTAWLKQSAGHGNPAPTSTWGKTRFQFDVAGAMVKTASSVTDSETGLGYRYDSYASGPVAAPVAAVTPRPLRVIQGFPVVEAPVAAMVGGPAQTTRAVSRSPQVTLRNDVVAVDLALTAGTRRKLATLAKGKPGGTQAWVVIEDVLVSSTARAGGFSYSVSAALPGQSAHEVPLTEINTFALSTRQGHVAGHAHMAGDPSTPITLTFPLPAVLKALGLKTPAELARGLRIFFRPVQLLDQTAVSDPVSVGSVTISTSVEHNK